MYPIQDRGSRPSDAGALGILARCGKKRSAEFIRICSEFQGKWARSTCRHILASSTLLKGSPCVTR